MPKIRAEHNEIDDIIESAINSFVDNKIGKGVGCLTKLAKSFASVGLSMQSFIDVRLYIIESAKKNGAKNNLELSIKKREKYEKESRINGSK